MYAESRGVPQDHAEAARWLSLAAEQGYADTQFALGSMYADAQGVPRSYGEAATWLRRAAEQGVNDVAVKLSGMYATAHLMCSVVDAEFAAGAKEMRDALAAKMTPE